MKNLNEAIALMDTDKVTKANELFRKLQSVKTKQGYTKYDAWSFIGDMAKAIGGYSKGSDIYDNSDMTKIQSLLGFYSSSEDSSFSFEGYGEEMSDLNEAYAGEVASQVKDFDFSKIRNFENILEDAKSVAEETTAEDLVNMFQYSSILKDNLYEMMTAPRG